jgi:hypothetical protein
MRSNDDLLVHIPKEIREQYLFFISGQIDLKWYKLNLLFICRKSIEAILKSLESIIIETTENQKTDAGQSFKYLNVEKLSKISSNQVLTEKTAEDEGECDKNEFDIKPVVNSEESKLNEINNIACLAHSLTSYLITVNKKNNSEKLKNLTVKIYDSVNLWISRLFRFYDSSILFHDQETDGLTRMCNMIFNIKYTSFKTNGYLSIKRQPAIYISAASKYSHIDYRELFSAQVYFTFFFFIFFFALIN